MTEIVLALEADGGGAHPAAPAPPHPTAADTALAAERAGFTLVTFDDSPVPPAGGRPRIEAGVRAAFAASRTSRIGLAPTLHPALTEPFHVATQLAALDHASHGRGAWVVGAAAGAPERATIGAGPLGAAALAAELADGIAVARALWDSWEDDAVIRDAATGRYLDPDRVHHVDFGGDAGYTVKGPLITPRPPQGQLVVLADAGLGLGERADVALVAGVHHQAVARAAADAREAGAARVLVDLEVALDVPDGGIDAIDTPRWAVERLARLDVHHAWAPSGRMRHVGSPAALVEQLAALAAHVDGVRLHPAVLAVDLPVLATAVLPALREAGLLREPASGQTLREVLGLPRPVNRFALEVAG